MSDGCFRYHKGTDFQANHNSATGLLPCFLVVLDTTKVQIFKQITTQKFYNRRTRLLFQIPQRYRFSSKSQLNAGSLNGGVSCFRYHKGTDFQANHNSLPPLKRYVELFQIPQRYRFSSKSQQIAIQGAQGAGCFRYHKGTDFQANHNLFKLKKRHQSVVLDTTKVQIFKQITTQAVS